MPCCFFVSLLQSLWSMGVLLQLTLTVAFWLYVRALLSLFRNRVGWQNKYSDAETKSRLH